MGSLTRRDKHLDSITFSMNAEIRPGFATQPFELYLMLVLIYEPIDLCNNKYTLNVTTFATKKISWYGS
jgi:hypothetical protein